MTGENYTVNPHRIIVVDDEPMVLNELVQLCNEQADMAVVAVESTVAGALRAINTPHDLLLLDLGLPDGSGYEVLAKQVERMPAARSLVLTVFGDRAHVLRALEMGAGGYVLKHSGQLLESIRSTLSGENPLDAAVTGHLLNSIRKAPNNSSSTTLTPREQETLSGLAQGLSYRQIAAELSISPNTLTDYVKTLYRKLAVNSRSQAVLAGYQRGLVQLDTAAEGGRPSP